MTGIVIVNFSHPLTNDHVDELRRRLDREIDRIIDVPADFDPAEPYGPQAKALVASAGLTPAEWQTLPLMVNLPSFNVIAALVLAQLHGLMGHFPAIIRLRPVHGAVPARFEIAEVIDLNSYRIRAASSSDS